MYTEMLHRINGSLSPFFQKMVSAWHILIAGMYKLSQETEENMASQVEKGDLGARVSLILHSV